MRPETKFMELKDKIIDKLKGIFYCKIRFEERPNSYKIKNIFIDEFSYIEFYKEDLTRPYIGITLENLGYYARIKIPSVKMAKIHLLDARIAETCNDYLSVFEELITYDIEYEYVVEILFKHRYDELRRAIYNNGDVIFTYVYLREYFPVIHEIYISKEHRTIYLIIKDYIEKSERKLISLENVPKVFNSITSYALKVSSLDDYLRLEEAIRELIRLVNVEKRNISDAIKELVEARGYGDVFGYQI